MQASSDVDVETPPDVLILIATQSFRTEELVEEILLDCLQQGCWTAQAKLVDEAGIDWSETTSSSQIDAESQQLISSARALLVVASTFGDGDPPNHATEFADWLARPNQPQQEAGANIIQQQPFAVFGLGDSTYQHFCAFGKFVDSGLVARGGRRLLTFATGDAAGGDQDGEFRRWCQQVTVALEQSLGRPKETTKSRIAVSPFPLGTGTDWRRSATQRGSVVAKVTSTEELLLHNEEHPSLSTHQRSVLHVSLTLPSRLVPPDLRPGDHIGIYPVNDSAIVERALQWLGIDANTETKILEQQATTRTWTERVVSAAELLAVHVNLAGRATPSILRSLLPFAGTLELRALARDLTHVETDSLSKDASLSSVFDDWVAGRRLTVLDLAVLFECRPSLQAFARACGPMQPRLYSLVSLKQNGIEETMTTVGLCMAVAEGGLCSNYVANLARGAAGTELTVFFRHSRFRFVADGSPALLVAAGSGVGPCVGFIEEELERLGASPSISSVSHPLSHIRLFFGCRTPSEVLYRDRMSIFDSLGVHLHHAFSRLPGHHKDHVQDIIRLEAEAVWREVFQLAGKVYVCGRLELLAGVREALVDVGKIAGGLEDEAAKRIVGRMEEEGRILTDCWSVDNPYQQPPTRTQLLHPPHIVLRLERHHARDQTPSTRPQRLIDVSKVPAWPSYLRLLATGELERRVERAMDMWSACIACGRYCETNRLSANPEDWGECRVGDKSIVASVFPHFGEEDCLVGKNGSGTIFFGACNLKCMYCQNWELSAMDEGEVFDDARLAQAMLMLQKQGCHNINFVSPTHNVAPILRALLIAAKKGLKLPLVWNTGGYDSVASLRLLEGVVDIYMPDSKYASRAVGRKLSKVDNYPEINQAAIKEMHRQVGELQIDPMTGLARKGVLVRHLILPCDLAGTCDVAGFLAKECSPNTFTNVMDQYRPEHHAVKDRKFGVARKPTRKELRHAHQEAECAGLQRLDGDGVAKKRSLEW